MENVDSSIQVRFTNCIRKFAERNNINLELITDNKDIEKLAENYTIKRQNHIVKNYGILKTDEEETYVNVKDIVGFDPFCGENNLFEVLSKTYDDTNPYSYEARCVDKLELNVDKMIDEIKLSTERDRIFLTTPDREKYSVSYNGCHRVSLLRFLYINDFLNNKLEPDSDKYKILAYTSEYDLDLTYINYILHTNGITTEIRHNRDESCNLIDSYSVLFKDGNKVPFTRENLIDYFVYIVNSDEFVIDEYLEYNLKCFSYSYESLKKFIEKYMCKYSYIVGEMQNDNSR